MREKLEQLLDNYYYKEGIFASQYEKQMKRACELGKIKFYDKYNYDSHMKLLFKDKKSPDAFDESFILELPNYNFLGLPIKRLIQNDCSNGYCYSIILALSLCFDEFKIATAELDNYAEYYRNHGHNTTYKHCFLVLPNDIVVDTTFGIVCASETYDKIFRPIDCKYVSSKELENCDLYQYIQQLKTSTYDKIFPQFKQVDLGKAMDTDEYWDLFLDWQNKNLAYKNPQNEHMENYFTKHISRTSHPNCLWHWHLSVKYHQCQEFDSNNIPNNEVILDR